MKMGFQFSPLIFEVEASGKAKFIFIWLLF